MSSEKINKSAVLYIHIPGCNYTCGECSFWISSKDRCLLHGLGDEIKGSASCGLFVNGKPLKDGTPKGQVTKVQSGYLENNGKYGCRNCEYYKDVYQRCRWVNENSPGDDPGKIHKNACCDTFFPS